MRDFSLLEKKMNSEYKIDFKDKNLLQQAFCHRSYLNENPDCNLENNERLEFLGDAVLELVITDYLYAKYPKKPEGELTNWRAALVNAKTLSETAQEIGLNDFLLLSRGESKELGKARQYILANTYEALVGAVYLDSEYKAAEGFIHKNLIIKLPLIIENGLYKDAKSSFQEETQEKVGITPSYKVLAEIGPDHAKEFTVGVFLDRTLIAKGKGSSKQEAEEQAAKNALEKKISSYGLAARG